MVVSAHPARDAAHRRAAPDLRRRARGEILDIARRYWDQGIRHLVALRGDPPQGAGALCAAPGRLCLRGGSGRGAEARAPISTSRSRPIPKCIRRRRSGEFDLDNLKRKIDAGAIRAITQFFFDTDVFLRFRDRCAAAGIDAPHRARASCRSRAFRRCCVSPRAAARAFPTGCSERFAGLEDDAETRRLIAAGVAIEQVEALVRHGVRDFISIRSIAPS